MTLLSHDEMLAMDPDQRLAMVVLEAEAAFWKVIAEGYPEIKTGNLCPPDADTFTSAALDAASAWVEQNGTK